MLDTGQDGADGVERVATASARQLFYEPALSKRHVTSNVSCLQPILATTVISAQVGPLTIMSWSTSLQKLAVPAVSLLVVFLAYTSQVLFHHIEPHPLEFKQSLRFNFLVIALLICYYRACFTSPGRVPPGWVPSSTNNDDGTIEKDQTLQQRRRWCRRCDAVKPPRAHHCKTCKRYICEMENSSKLVLGSFNWSIQCLSDT